LGSIFAFLNVQAAAGRRVAVVLGAATAVAMAVWTAALPAVLVGLMAALPP
jgi:hypothetical protein